MKDAKKLQEQIRKANLSKNSVEKTTGEQDEEIKFNGRVISLKSAKL